MKEPSENHQQILNLINRGNSIECKEKYRDGNDDWFSWGCIIKWRNGRIL